MNTELKVKFELTGCAAACREAPGASNWSVSRCQAPPSGWRRAVQQTAQGTAEGGVRRSGGCGAGGADAHGGRAGRNWQRLNFPTDGEVKRVQERGALLTEEDKAAAAEVAERQGPCK
jgi:hypothetical protein